MVYRFETSASYPILAFWVLPRYGSSLLQMTFGLGPQHWRKLVHYWTAHVVRTLLDELQCNRPTEQNKEIVAVVELESSKRDTLKSIKLTRK